MTATTNDAEITGRSPGDLERAAVEVAELAAELIRESVGRATVAGTKSTVTDLVTETDVAAEKLIRQELERRCPGSSVMGEELADTAGTSGVGWIVDPIDGTVNFAYDLPVVSVSIAATLDGVVVAGAVADVLRGEVFSAANGNGARRASGGDRARRSGRPIATRPIDQLGLALILTGFSYDAEQRAIEAGVLTRVLPACRDIRCMGSAALNLCWVACGRGDAFFERGLNLYDYAAGALIAAEAGARVRLPDPGGSGESIDDLVLVSAPGIHDQLEALVAHPELDQGPSQA
ncbi:MAG: inositol monophosphatase family protein [Actinomycetota bacterium]